MSPVSNKFKNASEKHAEKLCIQAVQDAWQASASKILENREEDRELEILFFEIENSSFTCTGA